MHRALKIAEKRLGQEHGESVKLRRMCHSLAQRYAAEEAAALKAATPKKGAAGGLDRGGSDEMTAEWLRRNGLDLKEWGLDDAPAGDGGGDGGGEDSAARVERIVAKLKSG